MIRKNFLTVKKGMAVALTAAVVMSQSVMVYAQVQNDTVEATNGVTNVEDGVSVSDDIGTTIGVDASSTSGTTSVTVDNGVSAENTSNSTVTAISATSSGSEAKTEVTVNSGNTTATGSGDNTLAIGINATTDNGGSVDIKAGAVTSIGTSAARGIIVAPTYDELKSGTTTVNTGAVTASSSNSASQGIDARNDHGTVVVTTGAVTSSNSSEKGDGAGGVRLVTINGTTTVNTGDITAKATTSYATGLYSYSVDSSTNVNVTTGTIQASGNAKSTGVFAQVQGSSRQDLIVNGDVNSDGTGILIDKNGDSRIDIEVDGTISGKEHNIVLTGSNTLSSLKVEVWKVDTSDGKRVVEQKNGNDYTEFTGDDAKDAIDAINYIIKVDGSNLTPDARTAHEGENVTLRVDVPSGYSIDSFYTAQGGTAVNVLQDSSGNYYIVVPRGGGVYVGVRLRSNGTSESSDRGDDNYRATSGGDSSVSNVNIGPKTIKVNGVEQKNDIHVASVSAEMKDAFAATLSTFAATGMVDLGGNNVSVPENAQIKDSFTFTADNAIGLVTAYIEFKNYKEGDIILCSYMDANGVLITVALTPDEIQNGAVILTLPAQCTLALAGNAGPVMGPLA